MPSQNLKICAVAHDTVAANVGANLEKAYLSLRRADKDTDLAVLPEMFNSGFTADQEVLRKVAEPNDGTTMQWAAATAHELDMAIWGTFTATDGSGNFFNRGFMAKPDGSIEFYDKRHLFPFGGEKRLLCRGSERPPIVEWKSWRLMMSVCYDIRFPVWNRSIHNSFDAMIVPANWAHSRAYAWRHLLIARAIENQCYVVGANRTGADDYGDYTPDDIMIFNNWGKEITDRSRLADSGLVYATFDGSRLDNDRERFDVWRDADDFNMIID